MKGRARLGTRGQLGLWIVTLTLTSFLKFILVLVCAVDGASALLGLVGLVEQRDEAGALSDFVAQLCQVLVGVVVAA